MTMMSTMSRHFGPPTTILLSSILSLAFYVLLEEQVFAVEQGIESPRARVYKTLEGGNTNKTSVGTPTIFSAPKGKELLVVDFLWTAKSWSPDDKNLVTLLWKNDIKFTDGKNIKFPIVGYISNDFKFVKKETYSNAIGISKSKKADISRRKVWMVALVPKGLKKFELKWGALNQKIKVGKQKQILTPSDYLSIDVTNIQKITEFIKRERIYRSKETLKVVLTPQEGRLYLKIDMTLTFLKTNVLDLDVLEEKEFFLLEFNKFTLFDRNIHNSNVVFYLSNVPYLQNSSERRKYSFPETRKLTIIFDVPMDFEVGSICYHGQRLREVRLKELKERRKEGEAFKAAPDEIPKSN